MESLEKDGFTPDEDTNKKYEKFVIKDKSSNNDYLFTVNNYNNQKGDEVLVQVIFSENGDFIQMRAEKIDKYGIKTNYLDDNSVVHNSLKDNGYKTNGFSFEGREFDCSDAGLIACISFCFGWGLANIVLGLACDVACGLALNAVCRTYK